MFMLNGTPLSPDAPFVARMNIPVEHPEVLDEEGNVVTEASTSFYTDQVQFPAGWIRTASPEQRAELGITEVADQVRPDDRFFWVSQNADGTFTSTPKDFAQVRDMLHDQIRAAAYSLLQPTDYKLVRKVETGEDIDQATLDKRTAIRAAFSDNAAKIEACTTTEELAVLQFTWPNDESA